MRRQKLERRREVSRREYKTFQAERLGAVTFSMGLSIGDLTWQSLSLQPGADGKKHLGL